MKKIRKMNKLKKLKKKMLNKNKKMLIIESRLKGLENAEVIEVDCNGKEIKKLNQKGVLKK